MIAVKFLKRFLMGASRGPKHQSTCQHLLGQQLSWRHRLGESKPLIKLIDGVILRLRRR